MNKTYRFEIRVAGFRPEFTEDEENALQIAFRMSLSVRETVTIVDNDGKAPVFARVGNGFIQVLR